MEQKEKLYTNLPNTLLQLIHVWILFKLTLIHIFIKFSLHLQSLIAGGIDTSAITLTWAICLLLKNPHTLEKAKAELDFHVGRDKCVTKSDINKLVYLQAIIKETLRLYPAGPLSAPREFTENCNIGGYDVKKGTRLILNLWKIQTNHNVWSDPLEFKPERFLNTHKDVDVRGRHFELLPFGSGRRICPGISFGLHMIHLTLANFLHSFEIVNGSSEPVDMTENLGMTNEKATPLEILVKPHFSPKYYETMWLRDYQRVANELVQNIMFYNNL